MVLGGPIFDVHHDPQSWVRSVRAAGFRAAYCPIDAKADDTLIDAFEKAARHAEIVIAEVGAWCSPLGPDPEARNDAMRKCKAALYLADRIGARCCVNVAGSRGKKWAGPDALDLTPETFDMVVGSVREIIDAVKPARTFYAIETMPWMFPHSVESAEALVDAVDRKQFAIHFDPVNIIVSPQRYFQNGEVIKEFIARLASRIVSCHLKDVEMLEGFPCRLQEVAPGRGALDYRMLIRELDRFTSGLPLMLEHLHSAQEYLDAALYVRKQAVSAGVEIL